jgi:hypothetical protein
MGALHQTSMVTVCARKPLATPLAGTVD